MPALSRYDTLEIDDLDDVEMVQAQRAVAAKATYVCLRRVEPHRKPSEYTENERTQRHLTYQNHSAIVAKRLCITTDAVIPNKSSLELERARQVPTGHASCRPTDRNADKWGGPNYTSAGHTVDETESCRRIKSRPDHRRRFGMLLSTEGIRRLRRLLQGHGAGMQELPGFF
ncbi:hypothetical protein BN946_scf184985.g19 [Trametes cinnabarina]|uniref:Uncharacterized protein n=1 Tax=Pycnoporus cinnabarinus TaxID=5643 RepID=A0A060SE03_PYCCI|nr:hypothetical protein BN946_scf184985.g19 [Trametes cinnabarina]